MTRLSSGVVADKSERANRIRKRPALSASIVRHCSVIESQNKKLLTHRCLTNFGYSGAPIIAQIGSIALVLGINSVGDPQLRTGVAWSATQFAKTVAESTKAEGVQEP